MSKPRVIVTRRWPAEVEARLAEHFDLQLNPEDRPLIEDLLPRLVERFSQCRHLHLHDEPGVGHGSGILRDPDDDNVRV